MSIKDWFKRWRCPKIQKPLTREQIMNLLKNYDGFLSESEYDAMKTFIYSEVRPIDDLRVSKVKAMAITTSDLFIDGHPELVIKKMDNRKFIQLLILGALPKEVALASRKFIASMRYTDIAQLVDHILAISDLDKEVENPCTMTPSR